MQELAGTRLVMARWDLRLHLMEQEGRVVGPGVGMEARGERQGRMTVWAAQQFLGTQGWGSPARELLPQGKVVRRQPVATAEQRSSAQAGLEGPTNSTRGDSLPLDLRAHTQWPAAIGPTTTEWLPSGLPVRTLITKGCRTRCQGHSGERARQSTTWRLQRNAHRVQFGLQKQGHEAARGAHVTDVARL